MSSGDHIRVRRAAALAFAIASTLAGARAGYAQTTAANTTKDTQVIDVVIVTAQRREENLIDVPIAVAAFSGEALERRQIDQATDLQLNVPNVSFTKTNFTGSNFQIRGIGVSSVAASGDSGVETALQLDADQEPAPVRDRVLRRAARRSAARPAGHAVRAQRDRRRGQRHRAQARARSSTATSSSRRATTTRSRRRAW